MTTSKKQLILDSALQLFSENGIHATSTASIVKAAGVATGTLFHHFSNKEELVTQLYLNVKKELAQHAIQSNNVTCDLEKQAKLFWNNALDWAISHPQKLLFCQQLASSQILSADKRLTALKQELGFLVELIKVGQQQGLLAQYPIELMAENCQGLFFGSCRYFIDNPRQRDNSEYRNAAASMFWHALTR